MFKGLPAEVDIDTQMFGLAGSNCKCHQGKSLHTAISYNIRPASILMNVDAGSDLKRV